MTDHTAENDAGLAEHEVALRSLWRELAEKSIEAGVDWPRIVRTLFADLDRLQAEADRAPAHPYDVRCPTCGAGPDVPCRVQTRHGVIDGAHRTRPIPPGSGDERGQS